MKRYFFTILLGSVSLIACNNSNDAAESTAVEAPAFTTAPAPAADAQPAVTNAGEMPATTAAPAPQPAVEGANPAHGQPGHRCDIPVGAPLSSPPGGAAQKPAAVTAAPASTPPPSSVPVTTAPGMNPPHGQPGHDCSIAVGAPLKK